MDQRERANDIQTAMLLAVQGYMAEVWTCLPGIVETYYSSGPQAGTADVNIALRGLWKNAAGTSPTWNRITKLTGCPVQFPKGGGLGAVFPLQQGDEVLLIFSSRCIDAWWQQGGVQVQAELRMHDLGDGFVVPGVWSQPSVASVELPTSSIRVGKLDSSAYLEVTAGGVVNIKAPGGFNVQGDTDITGNVGVTGDANITGTTTGTKEGTFNQIPVSTHLHTGVQSGGSNTGGPVV